MTGNTHRGPVQCLLFAAFFVFLSTPALAAKGGKGGGGKPGRDNTPPSVTIVSPSDGATLQSASTAVTGTATDDVAVGNAQLTVNTAPPVPLTLSRGGSFTSNATLRPGSNTITVTATDTSGNSATETINVTLLESPPAITITSPSDGDAIHGSHVDLRGTFQEPVEKLRYLPGMDIAPGSFTLERWPLVEGQTQVITVTGYDAAGNEHTASVSLSSTASAEPLTLTADTAGGEVPVTANFTLANNTPETITACEVDFTGGGAFTPLADCSAGFTHVYDVQALAVPTVRVETADGHFFTVRTAVSPYSPAELVASYPADDPIDLEVDEKGRLYILERGTSRVVVLDGNGSPVATVGGPGAGDGFFTEPTGIGLDHDGRLFVTDAATDKVQVFTPSFQHSATWGRSDHRRGGMRNVRGIDVRYDGKILLADADNARVDEYRPDGYFEGDTGKGLMTRPRDVVWITAGQFAASDSGSGAVHIWSTGIINGYEWKTPLPPMSAPAGLEYDRKNDILLIADEGMNRVTMVVAYDELGIFVRHIDALAGDPVGLSAPAAVARAKHTVDDIYYIADRGNNRVVKVRLPKDGGPGPEATWSSVRTALAAGDIETALAHFSPRTQETYRDLFTGAGAQLPIIAGDMGEIYPLREDRHQAVYGVLRYDDGKPFLFEIVFVRGGGGEWKILRW